MELHCCKKASTFRSSASSKARKSASQSASSKARKTASLSASSKAQKLVSPSASSKTRKSASRSLDTARIGASDMEMRSCSASNTVSKSLCHSWAAHKVRIAASKSGKTRKQGVDKKNEAVSASLRKRPRCKPVGVASSDSDSRCKSNSVGSNRDSRALGAASASLS